MLTAGIDIGSTITKIVIKNETELRANVITPTGAEHRRLAHRVMRDVLANCSLSFDEIDYIVATGYGRINVPFADKQVTEITCHMRGVHWLFPNVKTIIDIGGQDSKGIKVKDGRVVDFIMNDKCAAGTGRFLRSLPTYSGSNSRRSARGLCSRNTRRTSAIFALFLPNRRHCCVCLKERRSRIFWPASTRPTPAAYMRWSGGQDRKRRGHYRRRSQKYRSGQSSGTKNRISRGLLPSRL